MIKGSNFQFPKRDFEWKFSFIYRLWSDTDDEHEMDVISQDVFNRMSIFRSRLVELGLKPEPIFPKYCAQNIGECI